MNIRKIFIAGTGIVFGILFVSGIVFFAAFGGLNFLIRLPTPEITYGEFPCRLTYAINDEIKIIEDVIACEYDGLDFSSEARIRRKWKTYLKSGNDRITLLDLRPLKEKNEFNQTMLELYFSYGYGSYYMGEKNGGAAEIRDYIEYVAMTEEGKIGCSSYDAEEALEKYGVRLIKWEVAPPVQNNFKYFHF